MPLKQTKKLNVFYKGKSVGIVVFEKNGSFKGKLPKNVTQLIIEVREKIVNEGITMMGDVVAKEPIRVPKKYLLATLWKELGRLGIELRFPKESGYK